MNDTSFFSSNRYVYIPTEKNPKVALAIDDFKLADNAFKLYNPFSPKAKIYKKTLNFLFVKFNSISKLFLGVKKEKSNFVKYLEDELKQSLVVSLYFATMRDKIVMQLQSSDAKTIGYLKYPLNLTGFKHIENEINAFEILSKKNIIEPYMFSKKYDSKPFLLLKELAGSIGIVDRNSINDILQKFKRDKSYELSNHPRITQMKKTLVENNMTDYLPNIENICKNSTIKYELVYEHGDFAPWNIIKVENRYLPFDFEYFVENGLEYFDIIKYYYQIGRLLKSKVGEDLLEFVSKSIDIDEIEKLFELFLIKEISFKKEENESFEFEADMMKVLEKI